MDLGPLGDDEREVYANGQIFLVPAWLKEDEVIVRIAAQIITRKKKHNDDSPKIKPATSHGGVKR